MYNKTIIIAILAVVLFVPMSMMDADAQLTVTPETFETLNTWSGTYYGSERVLGNLIISGSGEIYSSQHGTGIVGGNSINIPSPYTPTAYVDYGETIAFSFLEPVRIVSISYGSGGFSDGNTQSEDVEAFDESGVSLGTITLARANGIDIVDLFGVSSISKFQVTINNYAVGLSGISYTLESEEDYVEELTPFYEVMDECTESLLTLEQYEDNRYYIQMNVLDIATLNVTSARSGDTVHFESEINSWSEAKFGGGTFLCISINDQFVLMDAILDHDYGANFEYDTYENDFVIPGNWESGEYRVQYIQAALEEARGSDRFGFYTHPIVYFDVIDNVAPEIILTGDNPQNIPLGVGYTELYATTDDGSEVTIDDSAFVDAIGSYTIYYDSVDTAGNESETITRTVNVVEPADTTPPVITLGGDNNPQLLALDNGYFEYGATTDDGSPVTIDYSAMVFIDDSLLVAEVGLYEILYNSVDTAGNEADTVIRILNVFDTDDPINTKPTNLTATPGDSQVILNWTAPLELRLISVQFTIPDVSFMPLAFAQHGINYFQDYIIEYSSDGGANWITFADEWGMETSVIVTGLTNGQSYDFRVSGESDNGRGPSSDIASATPVDTTPPEIILTGDNPQTIAVGSDYPELGATAYDNLDGDITASIVVDDSVVNTNVIGSYQVTYDVIDSSGNAAIQLVRDVNVIVLAISDSIVFDSYDTSLGSLTTNGNTECGTTSNAGNNNNLVQKLPIGDTSYCWALMFHFAVSDIPYGSTVTGASIEYDIITENSNPIPCDWKHLDFNLPYDSPNLNALMHDVGNVTDILQNSSTCQGSVADGYVDIFNTGNYTALIESDINGDAIVSLGIFFTDQIMDADDHLFAMRTDDATLTIHYDYEIPPLEEDTSYELVLDFDTINSSSLLTGIGVDNSNGDIYISASNFPDTITRYDSTGVYLDTYMTYGYDFGYVVSPYDIEIDSDGNTIIADYPYGRIQILSTSGNYTINTDPHNRLGGSNGIDIDNNGNIYVANSSDEKIQVYNYTGSLQFEFGESGSGDGQFSNAEDVAVDPSGNIYVADSINKRIQVFDSTGNYVSTLDTEVGLSGIESIDIDSNGNVAVVTRLIDTVYIFDSSGNQLDAINTGLSEYVSGLKFDDADKLYIADGYNARVLVYQSQDWVAEEDTNAPVITLLGDNPQTIVIGTPYIELGATASDNVDGDITITIVIDDSSVDTSIVGSYFVTYDVIDSSGNAAIQLVRDVNVVIPTVPDAPLITSAIKQNNEVTVEWQMPQDNGSPIVLYQLFYREAGLTSWDRTYVINDNTTSHSLSILSDSDYEIMITAKNGVGTSPYSEIFTTTVSDLV